MNVESPAATAADETDGRLTSGGSSSAPSYAEPRRYPARRTLADWLRLPAILGVFLFVAAPEARQEVIVASTREEIGARPPWRIRRAYRFRLDCSNQSVVQAARRQPIQVLDPKYYFYTQLQRSPVFEWLGLEYGHESTAEFPGCEPEPELEIPSLLRFKPVLEKPDPWAGWLDD